MQKKIYVIKGNLDGVKISNTHFTLIKPINTTAGKSTAVIDASHLLGNEHKMAKVDLEDYRLLD